MAEEKTRKMEQLYALSKESAKLPPPKSGLLGSKCPKCGSKLRKESESQTLFAGEGGSEFANRIAAEAGLASALYSLSIDHYTCKCGYEFAKAELEPVSPE